jgi:anti-sigma factor RsiW
MKCATDAVLRAFADGELGRSERDGVQQHLDSCSSCKLRRERIVSESKTVADWLGGLAIEGESAIQPEAAYLQFRSRVELAKGQGAQFGRWFEWWRKPFFGALGAVCLLVLLLNLAPTRGWGQRFLQMLRIQKLAVVPVDISPLSQTAGGDPRVNHLLATLVSDSVVVTLQPGEPVEVANAEQAGARVAFPVRTLDSLGDPTRVLVENEGAFHMTLDLDRIRAILQDAGRADIQVPDSVDGSVVAVHLSKGVAIQYGECNSEQSCIHFLQVPAPAVSVPPNLNMAAVAEAGLQLSGMSASEAKAFSQTIDWSSTLVLPIPLTQRGSSYRTLSVDGVNATLVERTPQGNFTGEYNLMWMKNGVIYVLGGKGTADRALAAAAGLS